MVPANVYTSLPAQRLLDSQKDDEWKKKCVDAVCSIQMYSLTYKKSTPFDKQINYDFINGLVDYSIGFKNITDPFGLGNEFGGTPATLINIPIAQTKINELLGEELKRKFKYKVICTGGRGVELKEQKKLEALQAYYKNEVYKELGIDVNNLPEDFQEPQQIVDFFDYKYDELVEIYSNRILKQVEHQDFLKQKFNTGFKHVIAVSEEIYRVIKKNDKPSVRVIDPRYFFYYKSDESPFIENSVLCKEQRSISIHEVIDEYSEYFDDNDWLLLDKMLSYILGIQTSFSGINGNVIDFNFKRLVKDFNHMINVEECVWASQKKIGRLFYKDEFGKEQMLLITDQSFKLTPEQKENPDNKLVWDWVTEWWEGTRIGTLGNCLYVKIQPCEVPMNPYKGAVFNDLNSKQISIVDYLRPLSYQFDVINYKLKDELAKAQGKKLIMDAAQIPKDMTMNRWTYNFLTSNIVWINSAQEGSEMLQAKFNQFNSVDLTLSQNIQGYILMMNKIEELMDKISGVNPQRLGQVSPYGSNELYQNATAQSYTITEPYFYLHEIVKKNVLNSIVEFSKYCYKTTDRDMSFLNSDLLRENIYFDVEELSLSNLGVFVADMQEDEELFTFIKNNAQAALQNGMADFASIVQTFKTNSSAESINILKKSAQEQQQIRQQEQEHEKELKQMELDNENNKVANSQQFELVKQKNELDTKIQIEQMRNEAKFNEQTGLPTYDEVQKNNLKQQEINNKNSREQAQQINQQLKDNTDRLFALEELKLKDKKIEADKYIATVNRNKYSPPVKKTYKKKGKK